MLKMKKCIFIVIISCLILTAELAQAQLDKRLDRFLRGEERIKPNDLRVLQLEVFPDPVQEGKRISFHVTLANDSNHSGRISLTIKDQDEIICEVRDVNIYSGENRIDFPETYYRFSRSDHCFTVEADVGRTRQTIDVAKEFCLQRIRNGWTMSDRGVSYLLVEDLDMRPDPATPGQDVRFRVKLRNDGKPIRATIRIQDKDQVVAQLENIIFPQGLSDIQFPYTRYSFQRFDHCFTVLVDFERTPYPIDAAKEFCAKPIGWTLRP
jgi:hypothetical protein